MTPHFGHVLPFCGRDVTQFKVPDHGRKNEDFTAAASKYKRYVDDVVRVSAALSDEQKMLAEFFDDKFNALPASVNHAASVAGLSTEDFVTLDLIINFAVHDTLIAVWREKARHDAVRPASGVPYVYGTEKIVAWGGPGNGVVDDLPANQWRSYLPTGDHPGKRTLRILLPLNNNLPSNGIF